MSKVPLYHHLKRQRPPRQEMLGQCEGGMEGGREGERGCSFHSLSLQLTGAPRQEMLGQWDALPYERGTHVFLMSEVPLFETPAPPPTGDAGAGGRGGVSFSEAPQRGSTQPL